MTTLTWGAPIPDGAPVVTWDGVSPGVAGTAYQGTPPGWVDPDAAPAYIPPEWATDPNGEFLKPAQFQVQTNLTAWFAAHDVGPRFVNFGNTVIDNAAIAYANMKRAVAAGEISALGTGINADLDAELATGIAKANAAAVYGQDAHGGWTDENNPNAHPIALPPGPIADPYSLPAAVPPPFIGDGLPPAVQAPANTGALPAGSAPTSTSVAIVCLALVAVAGVAWYVTRGG